MSATKMQALFKKLLITVVAVAGTVGTGILAAKKFIPEKYEAVKQKIQGLFRKKTPKMIPVSSKRQLARG